MQPRYETSTFAPNVQWAGIEDAAAGLVPSAPTLQVSDDHFYHTGLAAHHISQLFHSIDQDALLSGRKEGGPGIGDGIHVSHGPSIGPRAAPRSKTRPNVASKLTIQERRRLTRSLRDACCREEGRMQPQLETYQQSVQPSHWSQTSQPTQSLSGSAIFQSPVLIHDYNLNAPASLGQWGTDINDPSHFPGSGDVDILGLLRQVAMRPNPKFDMGSVDLSYSFTVVDAKHPEQPIIYCSDTFCELTGYNRSEVLGRNCRFLQSPSGEVEAGSERTYTDNGAVAYIQRQCERFHECKASLINYRRDGSPFVNDITIIPIVQSAGENPSLFVGFQAELAGLDGLQMPSDPMTQFDIQDEHQAGIAADAFTALRSTDSRKLESLRPTKDILAADHFADNEKEAQMFAKMILDNSPDFIYVLSLKGLFLYASPSIEKHLGYNNNEVLGQSLEAFCHPADVALIQRELRESTRRFNASVGNKRNRTQEDSSITMPVQKSVQQTGSRICLLMRMRSKHKGYLWVESVGKIRLEQGKGRKVFVFSGRPRTLFDVPWQQIRTILDARQIGFWSKICIDGLIVATFGPVVDVLSQKDVHESRRVGSLLGHTIFDVADGEARHPLEQALRSTEANIVVYKLCGRPVLSVFLPLTAYDAQYLPIVFVFTQLRELPESTAASQSIHGSLGLVSGRSNDCSHREGPEDRLSLSELLERTSRSWRYELHKLQHANKQLREQIHALEQRLATLESS